MPGKEVIGAGDDFYSPVLGFHEGSISRTQEVEAISSPSPIHFGRSAIKAKSTREISGLSVKPGYLFVTEDFHENPLLHRRTNRQFHQCGKSGPLWATLV